MDDLDRALSRLQAVLAPRVGKRMTRVVLQSFLGMIEQGAPAATLLHAIHQTLDAYGRIAESGTPFPLDVARRIGDLGCPNLSALAWRPALAMRAEEVAAVQAHADALVPAYGADDVAFAAGVAWKNHHHFRLHLVVGRALDRNDAAPSELLHAAWQAQGAPPATPIGVVPADIGEPGVVYGPLAGSGAFVFSPDRGDNVVLEGVEGAQRFFARVPLPITPRALAWIVHVVRVCLRADVEVVDEHGARLVEEWAPVELAPAASAAALLFQVAAPPLPERARISITAGDARLTYARGELSPVT